MTERLSMERSSQTSILTIQAEAGPLRLDPSSLDSNPAVDLPARNRLCNRPSRYRMMQAGTGQQNRYFP